MPSEPRTFAESVDEAEASGRLVMAGQSLRAIPSLAPLSHCKADIIELGALLCRDDDDRCYAMWIMMLIVNNINNWMLIYKLMLTKQQQS